jgi:hypothetical protein
MLLQLQAQTLAPEQLKNDFALFRQALHEVHPEMYRYTPRQVFDSLFTATEARLNQPMTCHAFYQAMMPLIAALRDGHVKWIPAGRDEHYPFFADQLFPLRLYFIDHNAWVVGSYGPGAVPAGAEIISINGRTITAIIDSLLPNMTFADGYTVNGKYHDLNHFFSGYYATWFGPQAAFDIVYRNEHGTSAITLPAVTGKSIQAYQETHTPGPQSPFRFEITAAHTAVITIERFWSGNKAENYRAFLKASFRKLHEKQIRNLVLDLRNNEGGNESYGVRLYTYLALKPFRYYDYIRVRQQEKLSFPAHTPRFYGIVRKLLVKKSADGYVLAGVRGLKELKPKRDAFDGEVYVLVNGSSFSVTTEFAARMHADQRATFIGQETGGGYHGNSSGMFTIVHLPNSGMDLGIPTFGFHLADVPAHISHGQGIVPDHIVVPAIDDILRNDDRVMKYTSQLIQSKAAASPAAGQTSSR